MLYLSDPVRGFVAERCVINDDATILKSDLYLEYTSYCKAMGAKPKPMEQFARALYRLNKRIGDERGSEGRRRVQRFTGIAVTDGLILPPTEFTAHARRHAARILRGGRGFGRAPGRPERCAGGSPNEARAARPRRRRPIAARRRRRSAPMRRQGCQRLFPTPYRISSLSPCAKILLLG